MDFDDIWEILDNEIMAIIACLVAFVVLGSIYLTGWVFVFSATFSYVASDAFMSLLYEQGDGYIKFGFDNSFQSKGHGFVVLFVLIVSGTAIVSMITDWLVNSAITEGQGSNAVLIGSIFATFLVFADLQLRFNH